MPPRETLLYRLAYVVVRGALRLYLRFRVEGLDNVPDEAALIVANHPSGLDPVVVAAALPRRALFVAGAEFLTIPFIGWVMRAYGVIPVRRDQINPAVVKDALRALEAGALVVIFPEGRISPEGGPLRAGAGLVAARAGVPIVPAAVVGAAQALPLGRYVPRPGRVSVIFGPAYPPPPSGDREAGQTTVEAALAWVRETVLRRY